MTKPKLCLVTDCSKHTHDSTWIKPAPTPRPVYAAGGRPWPNAA